MKHFLRRLFFGHTDANYVRQIQVLKSTAPMNLPPVKPLKAVSRSWRIERFKRRLAA